MLFCAYEEPSLIPCLVRNLVYQVVAEDIYKDFSKVELHANDLECTF